MDYNKLTEIYNKVVGTIMSELGWSYKDVTRLPLDHMLDVYCLIVKNRNNEDEYDDDVRCHIQWQRLFMF